MEVGIVSSELLKPTIAQPPNAAIPLNIFDKATFNIQVPMIYVGRTPMPPIAALREGLAKALNHFPVLAGRIGVDQQSRPAILLNDAGIRLIVARVNADMEELFPVYPSERMTPLHPCIEDIDELFLVQLNQFKCGGVVIGLSIHHRAGDGQSTSNFLVAWSQIVRGLAVDPMPNHDRAAIAASRRHLNIEFNHKDIEFRNDPSPPPTVDSSVDPIENVVSHYSVQDIKSLKSTVERSDSGRKATTFECVLADIWKKVTIARKIKGDELTQVRIAVTGRSRIQQVPMEYFGNIVLWAHPTLKAKDLVSSSLASVTKAIRDSVSQIDDRYFQSFKDFGAVVKPDEDLVGAAPDIADSLSPHVEIDSWLRLQFHEIDFGSGAPHAFIPACLPIEGLMIFLASCTEKGAADVVVALHKSTVAYFRQIESAMKMKPTSKL